MNERVRLFLLLLPAAVLTACPDRATAVASVPPELALETEDGRQELDFGSPVRGTSRSLTVKLVSKSRSPVHVSRVTIEEQDLLPEITADSEGPVSWTLPQDQSQTVVVTFTPGDVLADKGRLCIDSDADGAPHCLPLVSRVIGTAALCGCVDDGSGKADCALTGQALSFPSPELGKPAATRTVLLSNCGDGNQPLTLLSSGDVAFELPDPTLRVRLYDGAAAMDGGVPSSFPTVLQPRDATVPARVVSAVVSFQPLDLSLPRPNALCFTWVTNGSSRRDCLAVQPSQALCSPGYVDRDGSPSNGCECALSTDGGIGLTASGQVREVACNGKDDDCDGLVDNVDQDSDGYTSCPGNPARDCEDTNPSINPGQKELCDGVDNNCSNGVDEGLQFSYVYDSDGDRYARPGVMELRCPGMNSPGTILASTSLGPDCDDNNRLVHPDQGEICNGADDNCNSFVDEGVTRVYVVDGDKDTYARSASERDFCIPDGGPFGAPATWVLRTSIAGWDCDDADAGVNPGRPEICNGADDNCNGGIDEGVLKLYYQDLDKDSYANAAAAVEGCRAPTDAGWIERGLQAGFDCNDSAAAINPGRAEVCNRVDDNCNGAVDDGLPMKDVYPDGDGDGFYSSTATRYSSCDVPLGYTENRDAGFDCNDSNTSVYPGARELCDGILNNCSRSVPDQLCPRACSGTWPQPVGLGGGQPVLAQLDDDNELELVVFGGSSILAFNHDGTKLWETPTQTRFNSEPTLADVNLDGRMDVVYGSAGTVVVLNGKTGAVLTQGAATASWDGGAEHSWAGGRVNVFDLDNDGDLDLVPEPYGTTGRVLHLDGALGLAATSRYSSPGGTWFDWARPLLTDLNGDGQVELGVGTGAHNCIGLGTCVFRFPFFTLGTPAPSLTPVFDPLVAFHPPFADSASMSYRAPTVSDWDGDGTPEVLLPINSVSGGLGTWAYALDGGAHPTLTASVTTQEPRSAAPVVNGRLVSSGALKAQSGGAWPVADFDGDGVFEQVAGGATGLRLFNTSAQTPLSGYPFGLAVVQPVIGDMDLDGQADILYLESTSQSLNCTTLGSGTWQPDAVLSLGPLGWAQGAFETNAMDPYEPNDPGLALGALPPDPTPLTATTARAAFRAMPLAPFRVSANVANMVTREVRGLLGARGDRDYFVIDGRVFMQATLTTMTGSPVDYDLFVHFYDRGTGLYKGTRSSTAASGMDTVACDARYGNPCPGLVAADSFRLILEVRAKNPATGFGPWPYRLQFTGY